MDFFFDFIRPEINQWLIFIWPSAVTPSITWVTWRRGCAESSATQSYVVALPRAVPTWDGAQMAFEPPKPMPCASCAREIQISWDENRLKTDWKLLKVWCAGLQSCSSVNFQRELKLDASGRCKSHSKLNLETFLPAQEKVSWWFRGRCLKCRCQTICSSHLHPSSSHQSWN